MGFEDFRGRGTDGKLRFESALMGLAVGRDRALRAERAAGQADRGAEFHDSLVKRARRGARQQAGGESVEAGAGFRTRDEAGFGGKTAEDAHDVAIEDGVGEIEGDARHGRGGVRADARKGADLIVGCGERAPFGDLPGGTMQVAGTGIVAESRPEGEDVRLGGGGEQFDGGEAGEEALIVRDDGCGAGLLEHDFAQPDRIRIAGGAPGQVAAAAAVPGEKRAAEFRNRGGGQLAMIKSRRVGWRP